MNTRQKATQSILSFLQTSERFLLLTGTHQNEKHLLALSIIFSKYPSPAIMLFRANHLRNIRNFLSPILNLTKVPKTGVPISIQGGYTLYVDTINPITWRSSPSNIDLAMFYPIDSLEYDASDDSVHDLVSRKAKKIFLVSLTDNKDFSWTDQFNPVHVIFDAEEENPEYHKRMMELLASASLEMIIKETLPTYAASTPQKFLVKIFCRGRCHRTRWARLNAPYPGKSALRSAPMGKYRTTCLICGYEAIDNHDWFR